jgi:putative transposase
VIGAALKAPVKKSNSRKPDLTLEDARRLVEGYVEHYKNVRLNSAIGYITPKEMLAGRQQEIHIERDRKLEAARKQRQIRRQSAA